MECFGGLSDGPNGFSDLDDLLKGGDLDMELSSNSIFESLGFNAAISDAEDSSNGIYSVEGCDRDYDVKCKFEEIQVQIRMSVWWLLRVICRYIFGF